MEKKVIIFDLDGVLFDTIDLASADMLKLYPGVTPEAIKSMHKNNIHDEMKKPTWIKKQETDEERDKRWQIYTQNKAKQPMYKDMKEFVQRLAKKYILVINTSAMTVNCMPLLLRESIAVCFSQIATKEMHTSKAEKFKMISEQFGQNIGKMLFITDTVGDLLEAGVVNIPTIAVTWGMHDRDYFTEKPYKNLIAIVDSPKELEEYINAYEFAL
ncbi:MAG: putative phosphatase [Candidatus Nomurabacteria bacterium GW2011_GWB1_37_5]|uniref:Putative phosphatase n=1 Tax=Candidatus Nomurabacteria bacterium GW2011_GWB1_37_5 TaxID=1618742 RepID=A0A0G0HA23_9BACT|nr:MAG: putative phosphatase [Candidatus Nomurabacteria bacterium GW2011_GWB1_37_5]